MIVVVGESGSGKTSLVNAFCEKHPEYKRVVTYTTRPMREGEVDGVDYNFVSVDQFKKMIEENKFVEHNMYRGWYYGTSLDGVNWSLDNVIAVLTPAGLRELMRTAKGSHNMTLVSVYLDVDRRSRLIKMLERGDDIEEAYRRNLSDVGQFDGIKKEVDHYIINYRYMRNINDLVAIFEAIIGVQDGV